MWIWLIQAIAGSIIGSATSSWFQNTAAGKWFFAKVSSVYDWAAVRYNLKVLDAEDTWRKKYPNVSAKMDELESRLEALEKKQ
tara:strand:- start:217 stop:465 length:249 start_codon:yes stop_codon:yes gene_type:complete